ncbi:uncharacterized protein [Nothobranchius furzeri]|uniref:uncharacterized protein n=1 Tax=Nothobranchius furzeri TaxID=105023 RepID=UPI002403FAA2|nr:uncharacterized protein LOC129157076 isoform X2 [Nothobranchius furzeri]
MWRCKGCTETVSSRSKLLHHYKLKHPHFGHSSHFPCTYQNCPCTFKTWNALIVHQSKIHCTEVSCKVKAIFSCHLCSCNDLSSERDYFAHIYSHLKRNETVICMFLGCEFKTNIYSTFKTHRNRKHSHHRLADFKQGVVVKSKTENDLEQNDQELAEQSDAVILSRGQCRTENVHEVIEQRFAAALLKLEHLVLVPSSAIDVFLEELHHLICSASIPLSYDTLSNIFHQRNLLVDEVIVAETVDAICSGNPVQRSIQKGGPLSTAYLRKLYYKEKFSVVEPVEYILNVKNKHSFQYVPLLKSLQQLLSRRDIVEQFVESYQKQEETDCGNSDLYRSSKDGSLFNGNCFLAGEKLRIILNFYVDDFETCNPLGTSRKKHKLCAVYWVLANLPQGSNSSLSSIYLSVLCKTNDVKSYGYDKILEPLLQDLKILEEHGVYVPLLGESVKGTLFSVVADNLGAHSVAGFLQSFSVEYYCRFCIGKNKDIQLYSVASGAFPQRTKELHQVHVQQAQETGTGCFGVKRECIFTKNLTHFHVIFGYPPDLAHDVFEGIIPVELAHCLSVLISKKFFTLAHLNSAILKFPYKFGDKANKPHVVSQSFSSTKTVGGNAHENWSLLRFLSFLVGSLVPENEPAWLVLMDLKDITELVVAPVHSDDSLAFLESKILEHRQRYQALFPDIKLLPKHHYLEHYPQMIKLFGPVVGQWTMRFEAKHSFFKKIVRHTSCYKNIPLSLALRHQMMIAYHLSSPSFSTSELEVSAVSTLPVDLLKDEIAQTIRDRFPDTPEVHLTQSVTVNGITYKKGMVLVHRATGGLPEFCEIDQICILHQSVFYIVRELGGWYREHYRAFELNSVSTRSLILVALSELLDAYPLVDYKIGSVRMVTLKRHIEIKE